MEPFIPINTIVAMIAVSLIIYYSLKP